MLQRLVAFDTTSRNSNLELIQYIQGYLGEHGVESTLVPNVEGTKANLYASIGPKAEGGIVLSGHTDVVPVDGQAWVTDPFTLSEKPDGNLYGRGTCDMKGFIATCLSHVPAFQRAELDDSPGHCVFWFQRESAPVEAFDPGGSRDARVAAIARLSSDPAARCESYAPRWDPAGTQILCRRCR